MDNRLVLRMIPAVRFQASPEKKKRGGGIREAFRYIYIYIYTSTTTKKNIFIYIYIYREREIDIYIYIQKYPKMERKRETPF